MVNILDTVQAEKKLNRLMKKPAAQTASMSNIRLTPKRTRSEREDSSDDSSSGGGCFLTTACVEYAGLPDDCYELEAVRGLRERYIRNLPDGESFLREYYETAPKIVEKIKKRSDSDMVLAELLAKARAVCALIEEERMGEAFQKCRSEFESLKTKFGIS